MKLKEIYLNEMTTSSATPGYMSPKAFTGKNVDRKNDPQLKKWMKIFGWEFAKKTHKYFVPIHESLEPQDYLKLKNFIRNEIAGLFYDLWRKRKMFT